MILRSLIVAALASIASVNTTGFCLGNQALAAGSDCESFYQTDSLSIKSCDIASERLSVEVDFPHSRKSVTAEFNLKEHNSLQGRFWKRLWFSKGENSLTKEEQDLLQKALEAWGPSPTLPIASREAFSRTKSVVEFLAGFLEPGTQLEPFDQQVNGKPLLKAYILTWTPICEWIGKSQLAFFTAGPESVITELTVGVPESNCRGRCGWGCEPWLQWSERQYTQECLNHDACHDIVGTQLGECKDEFWAAAASYTLAPNCP